MGLPAGHKAAEASTLAASVAPTRDEDPAQRQDVCARFDAACEAAAQLRDTLVTISADQQLLLCACAHLAPCPPAFDMHAPLPAAADSLFKLTLL